MLIYAIQVQMELVVILLTGLGVMGGVVSVWVKLNNIVSRVQSETSASQKDLESLAQEVRVVKRDVAKSLQTSTESYLKALSHLDATITRIDMIELTMQKTLERHEKKLEDYDRNIKEFWKTYNIPSK